MQDLDRQSKKLQIRSEQDASQGESVRTVYWWEVMKDGMSYQAYFRKAQELYAKEGCSKEWKMHHQGGPTGYGCREFTVTPETKGVIKEESGICMESNNCRDKVRGHYIPCG